MAAILADDIFKWIFLNENDRIPIQLLLKFVARSPIDNESALVQVMAWRRTGDKPLPEPMMTQLTDAYMWHSRGRWVNANCLSILCDIYELYTYMSYNCPRWYIWTAVTQPRFTVYMSNLKIMITHMALVQDGIGCEIFMGWFRLWYG